MWRASRQTCRDAARGADFVKAYRWRRTVRARVHGDKDDVYLIESIRAFRRGRTRGGRGINLPAQMLRTGWLQVAPVPEYPAGKLLISLHFEMIRDMSDLQKSSRPGGTSERAYEKPIVKKLHSGFMNKFRLEPGQHARCARPSTA